MKVRPVRPKDVKNFVQSFKKPQTWFKVFQQLYPLGSGGLRTDLTSPKHDFASDLAIPSSFKETSSAWQTLRDIGLGGLPQGAKPARPSDKPKERTITTTVPRQRPGWSVPPYETPAPTVPTEIPRPDDIVEDVPQVHPVEESDEAEDEGETTEQKIPRRRPPEYDAWNCETWELLTGIPCIQTRGAQIQIRTRNAKTSHKLRKSKKSRKSSQWNYPF